jgi:predicted nucleotidyltransferase
MALKNRYTLFEVNDSTKKSLKTLIQNNKGILFAYLFGSQVTGNVNAMSDLDVAIYPRTSLPPADLMRLQTEIMEASRMARVDLVDLRLAPPLLAYEVAASGELLFTRDANAQNRFERKAFLHCFDTQHLRSVQNQYLRDHLSAS